MPSRLPPCERVTKVWALPSRQFSCPSLVLRPPRTPSRHHAAFGFTLSTWPRSDSSRRVGPLQFRTGPWTRAAPHTPEGSSAAPMSPRCLWPSPRHARLGSLCLSADNLTRRQASRAVAARALAPPVEALDAPLSRGALAPRPGPATERIGACSDGTLTRRSGAASLDAPRRGQF